MLNRKFFLTWLAIVALSSMYLMGQDSWPGTTPPSINVSSPEKEGEVTGSSVALSVLLDNTDPDTVVVKLDGKDITNNVSITSTQITGTLDTSIDNPFYSIEGQHYLSIQARSPEGTSKQIYSSFFGAPQSSNFYQISAAQYLGAATSGNPDDPQHAFNKYVAEINNSGYNSELMNCSYLTTEGPNVWEVMMGNYYFTRPQSQKPFIEYEEQLYYLSDELSLVYLRKPGGVNGVSDYYATWNKINDEMLVSYAGGDTAVLFVDDGSGTCLPVQVPISFPLDAPSSSNLLPTIQSFNGACVGSWVTMLGGLGMVIGGSPSIKIIGAATMGLGYIANCNLCTYTLPGCGGGLVDNLSNYFSDYP